MDHGRPWCWCGFTEHWTLTAVVTITACVSAGLQCQQPVASHHRRHPAPLLWSQDWHWVLTRTHDQWRPVYHGQYPLTVISPSESRLCWCPCQLHWSQVSHWCSLTHYSPDSAPPVLVSRCKVELIGDIYKVKQQKLGWSSGYQLYS